MRRELDEMDLALLRALRNDPAATRTDLGRVVGIARGTVYSRLDRMEAEGVIAGYGPRIDAERAGFGVSAFTTLEISQGTHGPTTTALAAIGEIVEVHTITGAGDLLCRVVARSNDHLHQVLQQVSAIPTVIRSETQLALRTEHHRAVLDVIVDS